MNEHGTEIEDIPTKIKARLSMTSIQMKVLLISMVIYGLIFSYLSILKYYTFNVYTWDLGIFDQTFWFTLQGKIYWNTPDFGHLHVHFDPILFLLMPIYALFQNPLTLLMIQSFLSSLGAIPVYYLAKDYFNNKNVALAFGLSFLLYPALYRAINFDFHPDFLIPFFLISAYYFYTKGSYKRTLLFTILALACKEIVAMITFFFGIYALINSHQASVSSETKKQKRRIGLSVVIMSVIWFGAALWIMDVSLRGTPYYVSTQGQNVQLVYWSYLGNSTYQIVKNAILDPVKVFSSLVDMYQAKAIFFLVLALPLGFLSFLDPLTFVINLPWLFLMLIGTGPYMWRSTQHIAVFVPFTFVAGMNGAKRLLEIKTGRIRQYLKGGMSVARIWMVFIIIGMVLFIQNTSSVSFQAIRDTSDPHLLIHNQALMNVIAEIPTNASLMTQNDLFPHVSHRAQAYPGYRSDLSIDYILVDMTKPDFWQYDLAGYPQYGAIGPHLAEILSSGQYGIVTSIDGILLLKKGFYGEQSPQILGKSGLKAVFYASNSSTVLFQTVYLNFISQITPYTFLNWTSHPLFPGLSQGFRGVFIGYIKISKAGSYQFKMESNGDSGIVIDDEQIIGDALMQNTTFLDVGYHQVSIYYSSKSNFISIYWQTPMSNKLEQIPSTELFYEI